MPQGMTAEALDNIFIDAENTDSSIVAEMRSNVLMVSGDHYQKKNKRFIDRIRRTEGLSRQQKLRLTKNHIQKIVGGIASHMLSHSPSCKVVPANDDQIQDQKTAEINNKVLDYYRKQLDLRAKTREKAKNYVTFGEVCSRTYFDPDKGHIKGYEPLVDEAGNFILDPETGQIVADTSRPIMSGGFVVETVYPFNLFRAPEAETIEESPYLIIRRMIYNRDLKHMVPPEIFDELTGDSKETFLVFNGETGSYNRTRNQTMVREHYYRPSRDYPNGYYFIATRNHIIAEGELPGGIWPIAHRVYEKIPTSCRGRSPIKQMRPYQIEINRSASSIATAQITLGDDKVLMQNGSKLGQGGTLPGVRGVSVTGGGALTVIPGRGGEQYVPYMEKQIAELYSVMNFREEDPLTEDGKLDPHAMLFRSIKNKRKFAPYAESFEEFTCKEVEILLDLARFYLDEDDFVDIVGPNEAVNIAEFKHVDKNKYRIEVMGSSLDAETLLGKQLALNHVIQFAGAQLDKRELGQLIRSMPYANQEEAFDDLLIDYDSVKNDILALERGEIPEINMNDDHDYIIRKLSNRTRKPDFKMLDPMIQQNFRSQIQKHQQISSEVKLRELRLQQGLIPTGGYLVTCDFYATNAEGKTKRVRLPYESINWLLEQLQAQGSVFGQIAGMQPGAQAEIFEQITEGLESKGQGGRSLPPAPNPNAQIDPRSGLQLGQLGPQG